MKNFDFKLIDSDGNARLGVIKTAHGDINTPVFMPVGTAGTVKGVTNQELLDTGSEIILGNTYHLYLRPGTEILKEFGGLHNFNSWNRPILTDSGGYQVFSLSQGKRGSQNLVKILDEGVEFKSYKDGSKHLFTPERVIDIQLTIGSDIMMPLDFCPSAEAEYKEISKAVDITTKWFEKAKTHFDKTRLPYDYKPALFAIIQGGTHPDLRQKSFAELSSFNPDGFSIGGVANAGESKTKQKEALEATLPLIPSDKPRYLMGVGEPEDLLLGVEYGVDMFDCVTPTRLGRHGVVYTNRGKINLKNAEFRTKIGPLNEGCDCYACKTYHTGYIAHLIRENEILGLHMASLHNIRFLHILMEGIRQAIKEKRYSNFKDEFLKEFNYKQK